MAKKILQDIVFNKRPENRNIPILTVKTERPITPVPDNKRELPSFVSKHDPEKSKKKKSVVKIISLVGVGVIVTAIIIFSLSPYFSSAIVKITPLRESVSLDDIISANLGKAASESVDSLHFQTMKVTENDFTTVTATGVENVSKKASGHILVFNDYSAEPQRLISGTRFESPTGKIYRIDKAISIPGKAVSGAGKSIPGSIDVVVYANEPGEEYNSGPTDYTIPGLKGGTRYSYVYARGKGEMTGGFSGVTKTALSGDIESAKLKLEDSLKKKLLSKARSQVPDNFILYDDGTFIDIKYNNVPDIKTDDGKIKYSATGTLKGAIFNKDELAKFIALKKIPDLKNYDVHGNNLETLIFKMIGKSGVDIDNDKAISFKLSGDTDVVWNFDIDSFKEKLVGLSKYSYEELFKDRPMVEKVEAVLSPTWLTSFPDNINKIEVKVEK